MKHEEKFAGFIEACKYQDDNGFCVPIIVASLRVLGDTVEEFEKNMKIAKQTNRIIHIADINIKIDTLGYTK